MNIARFRHLADAYGADFARWPATERAAAAALLTQSAEAQSALAEARRLDAWIALGAPEVEDTDMDRVFDAISARIDETSGGVPSWVAAPDGRARGAAPFGRPRAFWPAAAFLAGMAVMGVLAGAENVIETGSAQPAGIATLVAPQSYTTAWNQ